MNAPTIIKAATLNGHSVEELRPNAERLFRKVGEAFAGVRPFRFPPTDLTRTDLEEIWSDLRFVERTLNRFLENYGELISDRLGPAFDQSAFVNCATKGMEDAIAEVQCAINRMEQEEWDADPEADEADDWCKNQREYAR
jgi:hypothetical protein